MRFAFHIISAVFSSCYPLVPRLCLGTHCIPGSACQGTSNLLELEGGGASKTLHSQAGAWERGVGVRRWLSTSLLLIFTVFTATVSPANIFAEEQETKITFDDHIKPIFREHCTVCHAQGDASSGLALDSYGDVLAGGAGGDVVVEGNPDSSRLYALMTHSEQPAMPPDEDPVDSAKLELIKKWIEQGMPENAGSKIKRTNQAAAAMLQSGGSAERPDGPPPMPESILREVVVETQRPAAIAAVAASPWAPLLAIGGQEQVLLVHAESGELLGVIPFPEGEPHSLNFTRDGRQLLIGGGRHSHSGSAVLVDIANGQRITKVGDELDVVLAADISPDKSRIAIAGPQKIVRIYDSLSGDLLHELKKHTDWVYTLRYSPDGILLASGDRSNGLVVWEADSGNLYADLTGHQAAVTSVDFRADSDAMLSASLDGNIKLWDLIEVKEIKSWAAHGGGTNTARFSRDGTVVSAGNDRKIKLWNGAGELQKEFIGLEEMALRASVCVDAGTVAGGDWNGNIRLWKIEDPETHLLVAANPPSIQRRLHLAEKQLEDARQQASESQSMATTAADQLASADAHLSEKRSLSESIEQRIAESKEKEKATESSLAEVDETIAELKKQLEMAQEKREMLASDLSGIQESQKSLTDEQKKIAEQVAQAEEDRQTASQRAAQTEQTAAAAKEQLAAAEAEYQKAVTDQQALEEQAARLDKLSQDSAQQAKELSQQLTAAVAKESEESGAVEKLSIELEAVQDRLAKLQQQLEEINRAHAEANQRLASTKSQAQELEEQAEAAEQAAIEAQEQLEWFRSVYGNRP